MIRLNQTCIKERLSLLLGVFHCLGPTSGQQCISRVIKQVQFFPCKSPGALRGKCRVSNGPGCQHRTLVANDKHFIAYMQKDLTGYPNDQDRIYSCIGRTFFTKIFIKYKGCDISTQHTCNPYANQRKFCYMCEKLHRSLKYVHIITSTIFLQAAAIFLWVAAIFLWVAAIFLQVAAIFLRAPISCTEVSYKNKVVVPIDRDGGMKMRYQIIRTFNIQLNLIYCDLSASQPKILLSKH